MKQHQTGPEQQVWRDPRAIALLMAATLTVMANATISPALAGLEKMFMNEPNAAFLTRLLVSAPSLTVVIFAPLAGLIADRYGRRALLLVGVCLFIVAGSSGLFLPSLKSMLISRLGLGVAVAMVMTAQTALIGDYFTGNQRGSLMGLQTSARNFGGFLFISLAGFLAVSSPRLPFAVYGLALLYLPFLWRYIVEPGAHKAKAKSTGQVQTDGHPAWAWMLAALAVLQMLTNMIFFLMPTQLPFFLEARGFDSASMTGAGLGVLMLSGGTAALMYGRLKARIGYSGAFALGYGFMALGLITLTVQETYAVFIGVAAMGAGYALAMPNFPAIALQIAPGIRRGMAGGVLTSSVFLGQFLSVFISIPLIAAIGFTGTFQVVSSVLAGMAIVALSSRIWIGKRSTTTASIGTQGR
ncbi:MFS transporter [Pseudovibrio sp. Tun.PSC04-5.I4]|uniref:MFS transporter n=1 Tax=Pseudovibrio sp. Tun.PSC04-5.I4 TaxID=1798213 RepID=UPI000884901D|nr:MFS transporter [Pseudovibrio sp. Tun.PSC04-5.I4]SDR35697.1 Predicted arabinose efflux permease, MFS family [Pseudovibrio sp. Tun.PSC04-5.I4]